MPPSSLPCYCYRLLRHPMVSWEGLVSFEKGCHQDCWQLPLSPTCWSTIKCIVKSFSSLPPSQPSSSPSSSWVGPPSLPCCSNSFLQYCCPSWASSASSWASPQAVVLGKSLQHVPVCFLVLCWFLHYQADNDFLVALILSYSVFS